MIGSMMKAATSRRFNRVSTLPRAFRSSGGATLWQLGRRFLNVSRLSEAPMLKVAIELPW